MRRVRFQDEAKKRKVSIEALTMTYKRLLGEGKLQGIIDAKNGEFIYYTSEEIEELVRFLESRHVSFKELAKKLNLKIEQAHLVIEKLLREGKIKGTFTHDKEFISDAVLRNLVIKLSEETRVIDLLGISNELSVPREKVKLIIGELSQTIINAIAPYKQIKISDISQETRLPENFVIALLKTLISGGKVSGRLVRELHGWSLVRELPHVSPKIVEVEKVREETVSPKPQPIPTQITLTHIIVGILIFIVLVGAIYYFSTPKVSTFSIKIESNTSWSGSIGADGSSRTIEGYGSETWKVTGTIAVAVIQKQTEYGYLTVSILRDGRVLDSQTTTAAYGVVSVSASG
jgi:hypothetical protein